MTQLPDAIVHAKACELYTEYCRAVGGKAFNGDPLPGWDEFMNDPAKTTQAAGWMEVGWLALTGNKAADDEMRNLLFGAKVEIESLRRRNELLTAEVRGFSTAARLYEAYPSGRECMGHGDPDISWRLSEKLDEIEKRRAQAEGGIGVDERVIEAMKNGGGAKQ